MTPQIRIPLLLAMTSLPRVGTLAAPPFAGTIFIDPDIITSADPTTFQGAPYIGRGTRTMYDRRSGWIEANAYLFQASFADGLAVEIQVNPEFGSEAAASAEALKYGEVIGRLPTGLRIEVQTVWIHQGVYPFGGGNNNLLIHTGQADLYGADGILEETLVHEASHTSLDPVHALAPAWLAAQAADGEFISTYARDNPTREDIAESFLPYLAVRYRRGRISAALAGTIQQTIPNRIAYFENLPFDTRPIGSPTQHQFVRGDANSDGGIDISDGIFVLLDLFRGGVEPRCRQAADFNGSSGIDVSDAVAVFDFLFRMGPQPPQPYPGCGFPGVGDLLSCLTYPPCSSSEVFDPQAYYRLTTLWQGEGRSLDILNDGVNNNRPILATTGNYAGQFWRITPVGGGYYRLTNQWQGQGKSLDILNDGVSNDQPILANTGDYSGQFWKITPLGNGYYRLTTQWQGEGKSLDIVNDGVNNNQPILADTADVSGQYWSFTELGP